MREPRGWRLCARRPSAVGRGANNAEQCLQRGCSIPVLLHMCMSAPKSLRTLVAADLPRVLANPKTIRSTVLNTVALSLSAPPDAKVQMVCNSQFRYIGARWLRYSPPTSSSLGKKLHLTRRGRRTMGSGDRRPARQPSACGGSGRKPGRAS